MDALLQYLGNVRQFSLLRPGFNQIECGAIKSDYE
jgi:hypothetical protein